MSTPQVRHVLHELNVIFGGALIRLRAAARERVEDDDAGAGLDADGAPDLPPEQEAELAQHLRPGDPSMPDDQFLFIGVVVGRRFRQNRSADILVATRRRVGVGADRERLALAGLVRPRRRYLEVARRPRDDRIKGARRRGRKDDRLQVLLAALDGQEE